MIYDLVTKLTAYKGISKNLDAAIDYLLKTDVTKLPDGKHPVCGDDLIAQASHYETKSLAEARFEAHKKYIDIQMVLDGKEGCYYLPLEGLEEDGPFQEDRDLGFYKGGETIGFPLEAGMFAVFFPHDAHKPSCDFEGKKSKIHKVVLKVLA
ncbi:MAG: YhcH/YjgK/YiaL family protein [Spirochaetales bacterium]|jgi:YhcH/YjgK/YiaL family protein|nr:YhcH/YjgK/YiaL family protein [Spirochaetales bacterium]